MKKLLSLICALCITRLPFGLTACGTDYAKVTGIAAGIGTEQSHPFVFGNPLSDNETLAENVYNLQVGESYLLGVTFTQHGGSIIRSINTEIISLKYDAEILEITPPSETEGVEVFYRFTCNKSVFYTAVLVEVDGQYTETILINAK